MPLFENYPVYVSGDRAENRPRSVFDKRSLVKQSFRTYEFPDLSVEALDEDVDRIRAVAAEARADFDRELERKVQEAERRGQELGLQEAVQIHQEERAKLVERMEGAVQAFHSALDRAELSSTRDALRLGLMVAERIARVALLENPEAVATNLAQAVERMEGDAEVKVVASPELAEDLQKRADGVLKELGVEGFTVQADESLQPGDMMIYRGSSALDARVSTRLRRIEESLLSELGFEGERPEEEE